VKRRDFLKLSGAAPLAELLPMAAKADVFTLDGLHAAVRAASSFKADYVVIVHPSTWLDARELAAREAWRAHYREMRMAGRGHEALETWERQGRKIIVEPKYKGEVGHIDGFRIITQSRLP